MRIVTGQQTNQQLIQIKGTVQGLALQDTDRPVALDPGQRTQFTARLPGQAQRLERLEFAASL
jgi:hypothetical protein